MIAKIKLSEGQSYDSIVFLAEFSGANSKVIIFDESYSKLIVKNVYDIGKDRSISQNLVITNWDTDGMKSTENKYWFDFIEGFENKLSELPEVVLSRCKQMQSSLFIKEWNEITDEKSIMNLMSTAGGFHDGGISGVERNERYTILSIFVWGGQIHMKLENPEFSEKFIDELYIYDSNIFFENGRIYFVDCYNVKCCADISKEHLWFSCDKIEWKMTLDGGVV